MLAGLALYNQRMPARNDDLNAKQKLFRDMFVGVMIYAVVLGFFNDYTDILHTGTYSTTFAVAIVMQVLTYLTFRVKDRVVSWFSKRPGSYQKVGIVGSVWFVMFISKFIFLGVISIVFRDNVEISGFFGLLLIIITMTIAERLVYIIDRKLAD